MRLVSEAMRWSLSPGGTLRVALWAMQETSPPNGWLAMIKQPAIVLSDPFPLLDPGPYVARCTEATYDWARQWNKWIARLVLEPQNYKGRPYTGRLCKFLGLGKDRTKPYAGAQ